MVILDYLQLVSPPPSKRSDSRATEVSEMSRGIKIMAKDLGVPVIALSQLSRQSENRTGKRPQLSDLRESGAIEQDADIVILLDRSTTPRRPSEKTAPTRASPSSSSPRTVPAPWAPSRWCFSKTKPSLWSWTAPMPTWRLQPSFSDALRCALRAGRPSTILRNDAAPSRRAVLKSLRGKKTNGLDDSCGYPVGR